MSKYIRSIRPKVWWACGLALWLVALVGIKANSVIAASKVSASVEKSAAQPMVPQPAPVAQQSAIAATSGPIDIEACVTCHAKAGDDAFAHSKHGGLTQSCANCHAKASEHAKAQMDGKKDGPVPSIKKLTAQETNNICLSCHEKANQASFLSSMHARRNVACTSCHSVHDYKSEKAQLKTKLDSDTCFTCHKTERAKSLRASHHPVREGKLGCASCHNPHDGTNPKMLKADSVNELCYKCHTEKRGPFLYEHGPVREDCATCHDPHGSNIERLLVAKLPFLCQRCHASGHGLTGDNSNTLKGPAIAAANPPGITTTQTTRSARQMERSCKQCHIMIHGSNSASGWAFVR